MDNKLAPHHNSIFFTPRMKKQTGKPAKSSVKLKDLKPKKNAKGGKAGSRNNTVGGSR